MRPAALATLCLALGCARATRPVPGRAGTPNAPPAPPVPAGTPLAPRGLSFTQDGLHNCGTVAMLLSWASCHPEQARSLVRRLPGEGYRVHFAGTAPVTIGASDLIATRHARAVRSAPGDPWAEVVLAAFTRLKSGTGPLNFAMTEWLYAGEMGACLTNRPCATVEIKPELPSASGGIRLGPAISPEALHRQLSHWRGHPSVAYTNRRVHIWAILDYDSQRRRVRVRNPRRASSEWMSLAEFRERFQLLAVGS